jgi:hypothetical protein
MPTARSLIAGLTLSLTAISCTDKGPTAPSTNSPNLAPNRPVATGPLVVPLTNFVVTNAQGVAGVFNGAINITSFSTNAAGQLLANGTITGTSLIGGVSTAINQAFTGMQVTQTQTCPILHLDVGPIFLDLLGLQVRTNEIVLDVTAVAGPGNLLGNLLCAVVHLLDQNPLGAAVTNLLNQINRILAGL